MATRVYSEFARASANGEIPWGVAGTRIRIRLLMSNSTAGTQSDASIARVSDITTLDEHGTAGMKLLQNKAVNRNTGAGRAELDADDETFTALAAGARDVIGVLAYYDPDGNDNNANNIPCCFLEYASPKTPDGSDFIVRFDAAGLMVLAII